MALNALSNHELIVEKWTHKRENKTTVPSMFSCSPSLPRTAHILQFTMIKTLKKIPESSIALHQDKEMFNFDVTPISWLYLRRGARGTLGSGKTPVAQAHYPLQECGRDSCLPAVLCYKRLFTKACMGCKRFFFKERKNDMFLNKIDLPYCLVVFFVVCPRLRPFWSLLGEIVLFWCSTAQRESFLTRITWRILRMHDRKLNGCWQRLLFARQLIPRKCSLC